MSSPHALLPACPHPCPHPGMQTPVTAANLRRYLDAVAEATLGAGVAAQVAAFRAGFDAIFPLRALGAFYEDEIEIMLCGECRQAMRLQLLQLWGAAARG